MATFSAFNATSHPIVLLADWNYMLEQGLEKNISYNIRVNGAYYEALDGSTGKLTYGGSGSVGVDGTDPVAVINACITATNTAGGGIILLGAGTFSSDSSIILKDAVVIDGMGMGITIIQWVGAGADNMIENPSTLNYWGINNLTLDAADIASCTPIVLDDAIKGRMHNVEIKNTDMTALTLTATTQNSYGNKFSHIIIDDADVGMLLQGNSATKVVTANSFEEITMLDVDEKGIRFNDWVDCNHFKNVLIDLDEAGATGVIWNDGGTPAADVGIYSNNFDGLSVDAFGVANDATTTYLDLNYCKQIIVTRFYHSPTTQTTAGTILDASADAQSYSIEDVESGAGVLAAHQDLFVGVYSKGYIDITLIAKNIATYAEGAHTYISLNDLYEAFNSRYILKTNDGSNRVAEISLAAADGMLRIEPPVGKNLLIKLGDAAGANTISFRDSADAEVLTIDSDGDVNSATEYKVSGTKVVGAQAAAIADAAGGVTIDAEARAALNDLLAKLRTHGTIAT